MALLGSSSLWQPGAASSQVSTTQEQPDHPLPRVFRSVVPAVAVIATVVTAQELPDQRQSWARSGVPPSPAVIQTVTTQQEQPDHPRSIAQNALASSVITLSPGTRSVYTLQEQPDGSSGLSVITTGIVPHLGLVTAKFLVVQEQPNGSQGLSVISSPAPSLVTVSPVNRTVNATRQDDIDWAFVAIEMSVPGPNVAPPYNLPTRTVQESPDHPPSLTWARLGTPPTPVTSVPPINQYTYTIQEQPDFGWGLAKLGLPPVVPPPVNRTVITAQEQPDIGSGRTWPGVPPIVVTPASPVSHTLTLQETPDHPSPSTLGAPGVFGNPFIPPIFFAVYNTMLLAIPGGMASIPGDPPS